jgi:hypothetical protein
MKIRVEAKKARSGVEKTNLHHRQLACSVRAPPMSGSRATPTIIPRALEENVISIVYIKGGKELYLAEILAVLRQQ